MSAALPEVDGVPVFTPGKAATVAVAFVLAGFALVALVLGFGSTSGGASYAEYCGLVVGGTLVVLV